MSTFLLYAAGPLEWPREFLFSTTLIVIGSQFALLFGFRLGLQRIRLSASSQTVQSDRLIFIGFVLNLLTFPIALYGYTGQAVGDISLDLSSQGDVYAARYGFLTSGGAGGLQTLAALSRAISAPFVFGGIIVGFRLFRDLGKRSRFWLLGSVFIQVLFSFARGTDKEVIDIVVFAFAAALASDRVRVSRRALRSIAAIALSVILVVVFISRREARLGGDLGDCFTQAQVCADYEASPLADIVGIRVYSGYAIGTGYVTQGYHGLSLSQELDFQWTFGIGSHPALLRVYALITGDQSLSERTYQHRLGSLGWDPRFGWSSLYAYLANDVSLAGVPLAFLAIGFFLARSWRRALAGDLAALIVSAYLLLLLLYSPANNQIAVSLESMAGFLFWLFVYVRRARRAPHISDGLREGVARTLSASRPRSPTTERSTGHLPLAIHSDS